MFDPAMRDLSEYEWRESEAEKLEEHVERMCEDGELMCSECQETPEEYEVDHLMLTVKWECGECGKVNLYKLQV
jgi:hypothetical protein